MLFRLKNQESPLYARLRCGLLLLLLWCAHGTAAQQAADSILRADTAAPPPGIIETSRLAGKIRETQLRERFRADLVSSRQNMLMESIKKETSKAKEYIKSGIDTADIHQEFAAIEATMEVAGDGVFTRRGTTQTYRNLSNTYKIMYELRNRANEQKAQLDRYQQKLDDFVYRIDSLLSNAVLYDLPGDSLAVLNYLQKVAGVMEETRPVNKMLKKAASDVHALQRRVNQDVNRLDASIDQVEHEQLWLSGRIFRREFSNLGRQIGQARPFAEIVRLSFAKSRILLWFYVVNNWGLVLLSVLLTAVCSLFFYRVRRTLRRGGLSPEAGHAFLRYPTGAALVLVPCLVQFLFPAPPFVFSFILWAIVAAALTFIGRPVMQPFWWNAWVVLGALFLLSCINNLLLLASNAERIFMAVCAAAGVAAGCRILVKGRSSVPREKMIYFFVALLVVLEAASVAANYSGRYNLSKNLFAGGYCNVGIGFMFLWTVRFADQVLAIAYRLYIGGEKRLFYINFERLGQRTPFLVYLLLVTGWLVLFGRNFYEFRLLSVPFRSWLHAERTIGDFTYSISGILVFFFIIACSLMLSRIVSFFASGSYLKQHHHRMTGLGSWLLLVRVVILAAGFFLAFAAAGLPVERITLVLGALGVGIGFGLQALVNNLVSGLIIAFEKPVNVGDVIEINGQSGVVKSIGFRSSIIARWEGADLVIPNGDLLNAHLVNWTLGGSKMRLEVPLSVSSGADPEKVRTLLADVLSKQETVLQTPAPAVYLSGVHGGAMDILVYCWVRDYRDATAIRSQVLQDITGALKANGIRLFVPQQELRFPQEAHDEGASE